jgi:glycosyltransferase involved in cell wall biosynthesis
MVECVENIDFIGRVKYEETFNYYVASDLMVAVYNPLIENHKFSAPNKVYEAMALSKPIIVAEGTGIDKIVKKEDMGYVINYEEDDFINIINNILLNNKDLLNKSKNSGKAYEKYSWFEMKNRIIKLYEN